MISLSQIFFKGRKYGIMNEVVRVANQNLTIKEWNNQRVVTFKDIDEVHERPEGTARHRFNKNRDKFIEGEDYFVLKPENLENTELDVSRPIGISEVSPRGTTFLTESGYMLLVKTFTDSRAWDVQRKLVNVYFSVKAMADAGELVYKKDLKGILSHVDEMQRQLNLIEERITQREKMSPWEEDVHKKIQAWREGLSPDGSTLRNNPTDDDMLMLLADVALDYADDPHKELQRIISTYSEHTGDYKPSFIKVVDADNNLKKLFDNELSKRVRPVTGGYIYRKKKTIDNWFDDN